MALNPKDNPPLLFPDDLLEAACPDPEFPWWVVRTRTRQEKAVAKGIQGRGIGYFLPLISRPRKYKGRMFVSIVPLFDGYLFVRTGAVGRLETLETGRVAQILQVTDQQLLHHQLQAIARACMKQVHLDLIDFAAPGKQVRIISGPFAGLTGTVQTRRGKSRLVLRVDAIGQAVAVEISPDQIQIITT